MSGSGQDWHDWSEKEVWNSLDEHVTQVDVVASKPEPGSHRHTPNEYTKLLKHSHDEEYFAQAPDVELYRGHNSHDAIPDEFLYEPTSHG